MDVGSKVRPAGNFFACRKARVDGPYLHACELRLREFVSYNK